MVTAPDRPPDLSCGFHESLAALDKDLTRARQLKLRFDARPLGIALVANFVRSLDAKVTLDESEYEEGTWSAFAFAKVKRSHPLRGPRGV